MKKNQSGMVTPSTVFSMIGILIVPVLSLGVFSITSAIGDPGVAESALEKSTNNLLMKVEEDIKLSVSNLQLDYEMKWVENSKTEKSPFFTVENMNEYLNASKIIIGNEAEQYNENIIGPESEEKEISEIADVPDGNSEKTSENEYGYELFIMPFQGDDKIFLGLFYLDDYVPCCVDIGLLEKEDIEITSGKIQDNDQFLEILESSVWLNHK